MSPQAPSNNQTQAPASEGRLTFIVGRDRDGHWLAVETHGLGGGIFLTRDIAVHYALDECHRRPGAVRVVDEPISFGIP